MAEQLAKKEASDKQKALDEKKTTSEDDDDDTPKPKSKSESSGLSIETSSLADPFDASEPVVKKEDKPKETQKIQLKQKHHKKHKKHHKKHKKQHVDNDPIPDMIQISQIRDVDNSEIYGDRDSYF